MLTVAYLANEYPSPVEPYVGDEIAEFRRRGVRVIAGSVRGSRGAGDGDAADVILASAGIGVVLSAIGLMARRWRRISDLVGRAIFGGSEGLPQRFKALLHTIAGAVYAVQLMGRGVDHIHVHHGYFGSWIGMAAARLSGVGFSMTLHGSDLLVRASYLDFKLANCGTCFTISEYNRRFILEHYPEITPERVVVARLGVDVPERICVGPARRSTTAFTLLAVGRLHAVKDHAFLVRSCSQLKKAGVAFECFIAGDGPEHRNLQFLIRQLGLERDITLLGHIPRRHMPSLYNRADIVVLTSRSEGIPLVLMEAMACGRIVLAPAITGIPELVVQGQTGFLYQPGSMDDFIRQVLNIYRGLQPRDQFADETTLQAPALDWVRYGAHVQVRNNFNRRKNLESFAELFLSRISPQTEGIPDEGLVLQQI